MIMKVALCFWGLCRSTDKVIGSIKQNVYDVLKEAGVDYDVFVHTFSLNRPYKNDRNCEAECMLDNDLYKLLEPTKSIIEDQDEVDTRLNLEIYKTRPNPWKEPETFDNHVRSLYSLYKVTQLWKKGRYDYIIYLRPDVRYLNPIDINWFSSSHLVLADFATHPVCDRFAIGAPYKAIAFGERYLNALVFSKMRRLHSERFLKYSLMGARIEWLEVPFRFRRVRSDGREVDEDVLPP